MSPVVSEPAIPGIWGYGTIGCAKKTAENAFNYSFNSIKSTSDAYNM